MNPGTVRTSGNHARNRLLLVTAVPKERDAIAALADDETIIIAAGVGRVNAACATTDALLRRGPFDAVLSVGIAGALPIVSGGDDPDDGPNPTYALDIGATIIAEQSVYAEEGLMTPQGFSDMTALGFPLVEGVAGNALPGDVSFLQRVMMLSGRFTFGRVATVAMCSGTNAHAREIARRTGALAEAMEGAAVVHSAMLRGVPALEIRTISNTTGNRSQQVWDLPRALRAMGESVREVVTALRAGSVSGR